MATKTAVILLGELAILICAIPPLSPQSPEFSNINPTHIPPPFTIPFPDDVVPRSKVLKWITFDSWYLGSSHPLYFDMLCRDYKLHRFKLIIESDLSDASLHVIISSEPTHCNFLQVFFQNYRICEDALVSCWTAIADDDDYHPGVYTGLTSARFANLISYGGPAAMMLLPLSIDYDSCRHSGCPASGRFVLKVIVQDYDSQFYHRGLVVDFF